MLVSFTDISYLFFSDGPFLLLLVASIGSILIAILETLHYTYKTSKKYKNQINGSGGTRYYDLRQRFDFISISKHSYFSLKIRLLFCK